MSGASPLPYWKRAMILPCASRGSRKFVRLTKNLENVAPISRRVIKNWRRLPIPYRCHITRVDAEADFIAALEQGGFDLILADYSLPSFDGLSALKIARSGWPQLPLIFVSGTLGEEVAIEALKIGATDYVFKTRLSRIVPSIHRALAEAKEKLDRKRAEEALRRSEAYLAEAQRLSHTGSFGWDV